MRIPGKKLQNARNNYDNIFLPFFFFFECKLYCISNLFCCVNSCQIKGLTLAVIMV